VPRRRATRGGHDEVVDADPRSLLDLYEASGDEDIYARAKPLYEHTRPALKFTRTGLGARSVPGTSSTYCPTALPLHGGHGTSAAPPPASPPGR
jgi:hypothetical protein